MYGKDKSAGAVAGLTVVKNPIKAALAVMQKSEHVMMIGKGAEQFSKNQGLEIVNPKYFWTQHRWDALQKVKKAELKANQPNALNNHHYPSYYWVDRKFGTVGCVALDKEGNIAGELLQEEMTNKNMGEGRCTYYWCGNLCRRKYRNFWNRMGRILYKNICR